MSNAKVFQGNNFIFIHESHKDSSDVDLFLGPLTPEEKDSINWFSDDEFSWGDIAASIGMFPSKNQARKNNWGQPIEQGLNHRQQKKGKFVKKDIWVLNKFNF